MSRINTNVSSLIGRNNLNRANASLSQALTRLSTGLRINTGKDDPAGLIASENLRSDITSIKKAIGNTDRAIQVIATADSSLGQVSSLLNDIRGLVTESANAGALSDAQVAANQLQLDSSLEALNRIAQTTTFQGRRLLDGSLDFTTSAGVNFGRIENLKIDQANLGTAGSVDVNVAISAAATRAQVSVDNIPAATSASAASGELTFAFAGVASSGTLTLDSGDTIDIEAAAAGVDFDGLTIEITDDAGGNTASYDAGTNTIAVTIDITGGDTTADLETLIDGLAEFSATTAGTAALDGADATTFNNVTSGGVDAGNDVVTITAANAGTEANGVTVTLVEANGHGATPTAAIVNGNIEVTVDDTANTSINDIVAAIDALEEYNATLTTSEGSGAYEAGGVAPTATLADGALGSGGITQDVVFELSGRDGTEVFNVKAGASITDLVNQINSVSDATGVTAAADGTTLNISSSDYGSNGFVEINILEEVAGGTFSTAIDAGTRAIGTNVTAKVNGIDAFADGNNLSINTATLDLTIDVQAGYIGDIGFTITGGGALFQLGPDVVSNQQARLGITSVNTSSLGGVSGKLYQLQSGGTADLRTDLTSAANIVEEAIDQVTSLRGRLGAFQRTTLDTNKNALNDTLANLTEAESSIRDADFAEETANLTRSQILVQSGTRVLSISNQNPQNVLALLG